METAARKRNTRQLRRVARSDFLENDVSNADPKNSLQGVHSAGNGNSESLDMFDMQLVSR
jgi:hypothetical protein